MLTTIVYLVLGLLIVLLAVALLLPREITVERTLAIDRPAEAIFPWITNLRTWADWTVWNKAEDPTLTTTYGGAASGQGATMSWTARKLGGGTLAIVEEHANQFIRYELRMAGRPMVVRGNIELESAGGGATLVMWYDSVDLGFNPVRRWMGLLIRPTLGQAFHRNLIGLKRAAETGAAAGPGSK